MKPTRILFIGNSFTQRNDLPGLISSLAASLVPPRQVLTQRVIANGMSLRAHLNKGEAARAIASSDWNYVVLQEQSTLPLKNPARFHESVTLFDDQIRAHKAKTALYLTWARKSTFERQDELTAAYTSIGQRLRAIVVPVGVAWKAVLRKYPALGLYDKDGSHASPLGTYLAACTFVAALFQRTPVGLPPLAGISDSDAAILQAAAWDAVNS